MTQHTLHSRIRSLMQKSRKAVRLYSQISRFERDKNARLREKQTEQWRVINTELVDQLKKLLGISNQKQFRQSLLAVRDRFHEDFKLSLGELFQEKKGLDEAIAQEDYVSASLRSEELVTLRARNQALEAVCCELHAVIRNHGVVEQSGFIESLAKDQPLPFHEEPFTEEEVASFSNFGEEEVLQSNPKTDDDILVAKVIPLQVKNR